MPVVYVSDYIHCSLLQASLSEHVSMLCLMEHFFLLLQRTRFAISKYRTYKTSSDQAFKLYRWEAKIASILSSLPDFCSKTA
jgi:hypothetical protein